MTKYSQRIFKYVKIERFLKDFCKVKYDSSIRQKIVGIDSNGNPGADFTAEEKEKISIGLKKIAEYLLFLAHKK